MGASLFLGPWQRPQLVPAPERGMTRSHPGYTESEEGFGNGGAAAFSSWDSHALYDWNFSARKQTDAVNLDVFLDMDKGVYGRGHIYFADPNEFETNGLRSQIAQPGLLELGDYTPIFDQAVSFSDVVSTIPGAPLRKATWSWTPAGSGTIPSGKLGVWTLLIPPDKTLYLGATGARTGTAVVRAQTILIGGALGPTVDLTLGSESVAPVLANTFSGATYQAVRIYITTTSAVASTLTLTSLISQLRKPTLPAPLLTRYISGRGAAGLAFKGAVMPEVYSKLGMKGLSFSLMEVEPWQLPR